MAGWRRLINIWQQKQRHWFSEPPNLTISDQCMTTKSKTHLICSMDWRSGLSPPWQQKIFSSTIAATGRLGGKCVRFFRFFCWNHFHIDACFTSMGAQLHNWINAQCTIAPTGRSWPDVVLSDFELVLACSARACCTWKQDMPSEHLLNIDRSSTTLALAQKVFQGASHMYIWSTTDMAHQENENLDQKLHLPKMQNSVPVQSFALGAVIKRINYLTFYLALQHKLLEINTPKYKPFVRNTEESDIDGMWIGCLTSWNSLWRSSTAWCCTSVCLKEKSELINRTNHVEP